MPGCDCDRSVKVFEAFSCHCADDDAEELAAAAADLARGRKTLQAPSARFETGSLMWVVNAGLRATRGYTVGPRGRCREREEREDERRPVGADHADGVQLRRTAELFAQLQVNIVGGEPLPRIGRPKSSPIRCWSITLWMTRSMPSNVRDASVDRMSVRLDRSRSASTMASRADPRSAHRRRQPPRRPARRRTAAAGRLRLWPAGTLTAGIVEGCSGDTGNSAAQARPAARIAGPRSADLILDLAGPW